MWWWIERMDRVFLVGAIVFVVGVISGVGILVIAGLALETVGFVQDEAGPTTSVSSRRLLGGSR
jgi:hypothetical protein